MSKGNRTDKGEKALRWLTEKSPFPRKLRYFMEKEGVTQQALADAIGVTRQTISLYVGGQTVPDIYTVQLIADFFKVSVIALLDDQGIVRQSRDFEAACRSYVGPDCYELVMDIMRLTDEGRAKVAARLEELHEIPKYWVEYHECMEEENKQREAESHDSV